MSQYLLSVHGSVDDEMPSTEEMQPVFEAVDAFNERLKAEGAWAFGGGLMPIESNEGYLASSGEAPIRDELTAEAIRLGRVLRELMPQTSEVAGLLALMLLTEARRTTRVAGGELVPLHEQDRGGWDRADRRGPRPGPGVPGRQPSRPVPAARRRQRRAH